MKPLKLNATELTTLISAVDTAIYFEREYPSDVMTTRAHNAYRAKLDRLSYKLIAMQIQMKGTKQ